SVFRGVADADPRTRRDLLDAREHDHGSGVTRLTEHSAFDGLPAWSPDGTRIAFTSDRDGNDEIYMLYVPAR
ncbi:MAG: hypothetical protein F4X23_10880, partial [Gemmatimonadales bacterium]|nr:hypothetical protein [Gemmatimonadales bacterium]